MSYIFIFQSQKGIFQKLHILFLYIGPFLGYKFQLKVVAILHI